MGLPEGKAYLWLDWLSESQKQAIAQTRAVVERALSNNLLPHFTDHSLGHSERVIALLGLLLEENLSGPEQIRITDDEALIVVIAALCHDVGMQVPKAHGIETPASEFSWDNLLKMREDHGEVSALIIRNSNNGGETYGISLPVIGMENRFAFAASICENHQSKTTYEPSRSAAFGNGHVRIGFLTALLRLADHLDCDSNRVRMDDLKRFEIPPESVLRWLLCHYVDAVTIEGGIVRVTASFPKTFSGPIINELSKEVLGKAKAEYETGVDGLWPNLVRLRLPEKIITTGEDLTYKKSGLPPAVETLVLSRLSTAPPTNAAASEAEKGRAPRKDATPDLMSYWGFVGNPFLDRPVAYGSDLFVETPQVGGLINETAKHLEGKTGDLRLVISARGMGKTTLFQTIQKRLPKEYEVLIIDVADKVAAVRSALELQQIILRSLSGVLDPEGTEVSSGRLVDLARMGKRKVVCVDSLDRLPKEKMAIVPDFFKLAQRFLTDFRSGAVLLISCSDLWASQLADDELSYLGFRNRWALAPFTTEEIREMLERRLVTSGSTYEAVFDPSCAAALHTLSDGIPRRVLERAEKICRIAAAQGQRVITGDFIRENSRGELEKILQDLIGRLSRESAAPRKAIDQIYVYYLDMERRNLDTDEGWRYLLTLLKGQLMRGEVSVQFYPIMRHIASIQDSASPQGKEPKYRPLPEIKEFFTSLRKGGITKEDFIAFYAPNPFGGLQQGADILIAQLSLQGSEEHIVHFEKARQSYLDAKASVLSAPHTIRKAWDAIEELVLAILIRHSKFDARGFEASLEAAYFTDKYGVKRVRDHGGPVFAEASFKLVLHFKQYLKDSKIWVDHLNGLDWILKTRNNIVKSRTEYHAKYGEKEKELCVRHLESVFKELLGHYEEAFAS